MSDIGCVARNTYDMGTAFTGKSQVNHIRITYESHTNHIHLPGSWYVVGM